VKFIKSFSVCLAVGLILSSGIVQSADDVYVDPNLEPVFHPLPDNIEILRLENGLEVILMHNPAQPMVGIYTQVKVGSAREDYREKYTQEEQYDIADRAGAYNNANTTDFFTNYMMVIPAGQLETGLDIQSQMLFHSTLPEDKFAKEKGIVIGEIVQGRDWPGHYAQTALRQALFAGSSLELPTLGTKSTIEHMVRDDVYDFYKYWYVPNNMVLTMAGNFDREKALELLETYYGSPAPGSIDREGLKNASLIHETTSISRFLRGPFLRHDRVFPLPGHDPSAGPRRQRHPDPGAGGS